ncbi:MAG: hypothetical protein AAF517_20480 [Planctomycetota bacterium]
MPETETFETWKDELRQTKNPVALLENEPLTMILEKMVSLSELMDEMERDCPALLTNPAREISMDNLDELISREEI